MKKLLLPALLLYSSALLPSVELKSPNGNLMVQVVVKENQLFYSVSHSQAELLRSSRIIIEPSPTVQSARTI